MLGPSTGFPRCFESCKDGLPPILCSLCSAGSHFTWKITGIAAALCCDAVAEGDRQETCTYAFKKLLAFSPLSDFRNSGRPRRSMTLCKILVTRWLGILVSVSSAKHSRVKASTTLNTLSRRPLAVTSLAKSIAHSWLGAESVGRCV